MSIFGVIMDGVLMLLLVAALAFGVRLDKRLKALKSGQEDFARAVSDLDEAAIKAHESLSALHGGADESQELLHGRVLAARELIQKLDQRIARAERLAIEIEGSRNHIRTEMNDALEARVDATVEARLATLNRSPNPMASQAYKTPPQRPAPSVADDDDDDDSPETLELLRQALRSNRLDVVDEPSAHPVGQRLTRLRIEGGEPAPRGRQNERQNERQMQRPELRTRRMGLERDLPRPQEAPAPERVSQAMQERLRLTETVMETLNETLGSLAKNERDRTPQRPMTSQPTGQSRREDDLFASPDNRRATRRTPPGDI